jgi:hypothetical protein
MKSLCIAAFLLATTSSFVSAETPHPNIIVMMADDI